MNRLSCRKPPDCHHESRIQHRCHFGQCPPCNLKCDLVLEKCQHRCLAQCHDAVMCRVDNGSTAPRAGPWELRQQPSANWELVKKPCPPCSTPVLVTCLGGHEVSYVLFVRGQCTGQKYCIVLIRRETVSTALALSYLNEHIVIRCALYNSINFVDCHTVLCPLQMIVLLIVRLSLCHAVNLARSLVVGRVGDYWRVRITIVSFSVIP